MTPQLQSLQQYQQNIRQSVEQELVQQQQRNSSHSITPEEQSAIQKMTGAVMDGLAQGWEHTKQYGKEVLTGQKLWEGLMANDERVYKQFVHGSSEFANILLHGHAAPLYAHSFSPAYQSTEVGWHQQVEPLTVEAPEQPELQPAIDVQTPQQTSLELYQRGLYAEQQHDKEMAR